MCTTLKEKPKMFFIQACRGKHQIKRNQLEGIEQDSGDPPTAYIPQEADFFIGFATPLGSTAYRSPHDGSWYISELCKVLKTYSNDKSLDEMMMKVNHSLSTKEVTPYKQTAEFVNRLTKTIHFSKVQNKLPRPPTPPISDSVELIYGLDPSIKDEYSYIVRLSNNYKIIELIFILFLVFRIIASIFKSICDKGGTYTVFRDGLHISEFANRIITILLRILGRVFVPYIFYRQLYSMSESKKTFSLVKDLKKKGHSSPEFPAERHQHVTLWSTVSHAIMFSAILLYLGAILTVESQFKGNSICIKEVLQIQVPLIGLRFFALVDCLTTFFILMLVGLVKDCYCIENRLSTEYNSKYFDIIRNRWYRVDIYCYTMPFLLTLFFVISLFYNRPITPVHDHQLNSDELEMWCFWVTILSLLLFFGSSSNWTAKVITVIGNVLAICCAICFTMFLGIVKATFPPGTTIILIYSHLSFTTINLLLCLLKTHYRHKKVRTRYFWLSLLCLVLLCGSFCGMIVREVIALANYVVWPSPQFIYDRNSTSSS